MNVLNKSVLTNAIAVLAGLAILSTAMYANITSADAFPDPDEMVEKLNGREEGVSQTRKIKMELTNKRGRTRTREVESYRRYFGEESRRTLLFYTSPSNIKDTGFLTFDYPESEKDDDQWLYLPALGRVRRISASDRGDYFLGTDFSYEDIKKEGKTEPADYTFETTASKIVDGHQTWVVTGTPRNDKIAKELGYSRHDMYIDPKLWISRRGEFWEVNGKHLKTVEFRNIEIIQGIATAMQIKVTNHKTSHSTVFTFSDTDYETDIDKKMFNQSALKHR